MGKKGNFSGKTIARMMAKGFVLEQRWTETAGDGLDLWWYDAAAKSYLAAFERLLADEVLQTDEKGKVLSKTEIIANAKSGTVKFEVGQSDEVKVHVYGDTALVTSQWTEKSINKGEQTIGTMRNTVVYVKKLGNWQVVSDQVTRIAPQKSKS